MNATETGNVVSQPTLEFTPLKICQIIFDLFPRPSLKSFAILSYPGPDPGHPLVHPPECPMVEMGEDPAAAKGDIIAEDIASRGVAVGSVALVESSDGKVGRRAIRQLAVAINYVVNVVMYPISYLRQ